MGFEPTLGVLSHISSGLKPVLRLSPCIGLRVTAVSLAIAATCLYFGTMYPSPSTTLSPHEHFARGAIGVAYKRYLGTHRRDDSAESMQQFAEVMTDRGTETFVGKSREDIVRILGERTPMPHVFAKVGVSR